VPKIVKADAANIRKAASIIRDGGVVAFPTETVYGLGCDTFNERAALDVYRIKRRPSSNPLIAHVLDVQMAKRVAIGWDVRCADLGAKRESFGTHLADEGGARRTRAGR